MMSIRRMPALLALTLLAGLASSGCGRTFVVVPRPATQFTATDTLYATHKGRDVRVTFRFDSILRVDTVVRVRVDTAWVRGSRTIVRVDTLLRVDTVRVPMSKATLRVDTLLRVDTVRVPMMRPLRVDTLLRVDTVRVPTTQTIVRTDTVTRVDTVRVPTTQTIVRVDTLLRVDTVRVPTTQTIVRTDTVTRVDTVRVPTTQTIVRTDTVTRVDTVRVPTTQTIVRTDTVTRTDTLRVVVTDTVIRTVRVPGRRMLFVPPGHYPPEGQCRVWIHDLPPGRQAQAAACAELGDIPAGAFILFGGEAWDFDYDWIAEAEARSGTIPPEIVALKRRRGR